MAAADDVDRWVMACVPAAVARGPFQFDVVNANAAWGVNTDTQMRDVSEILDLLALAETPFINAVGWGPETGGTVIEWISEDLGPGYIKNLSAGGSGAVGLSLILNSIDGVQGSDLAKQLHEGTVLYVYNSEDAYHNIRVITSEPAVSDANVTIHASALHILGDYGTGMTTVNANTNWYILGNVQNEGSIPGYGKPRQRKVLSNAFAILREDVNITGSMRNTDMYVIGKEDAHQIKMRLKEMQREREKIALYSAYLAKTSISAGLPNGVFGFLNTQSGTHIDRSTTALTETAVNNIVRYIWERGGRNLKVFGHINQTAKFTRWDKNRIRIRVNEKRGGGYITSYLTEAGIELDLVPMGNVPENLMFILDTSKIRLRAKKNRKAVMEMLGKAGDFDAWQIISEFSIEMRGYNLAQHGMFTLLT
jgi:hypothetical protein